ncbi:hypothetical protein RRF57_007663 [Xylaria bambusicola]|uniref:Uncharacterized protein n=1 Tax=Xylaria bambusicola TaxID=326684 RepID=A0AAN7UVN3_9PEZI
MPRHAYSFNAGLGTIGINRGSDRIGILDALSSDFGSIYIFLFDRTRLLFNRFLDYSRLEGFCLIDRCRIASATTVARRDTYGWRVALGNFLLGRADDFVRFADFPAFTCAITLNPDMPVLVALVK